VLTPRGGIEVKGKGRMDTFFVEGRASKDNHPAFEPTTIGKAT